MCRAPCLEELGARSILGMRQKMMALVRTVPMEADNVFGAHIVGLIDAPHVCLALKLTEDDVRLLRDVAYQTFTQDNFFQHLALLNL